MSPARFYFTWKPLKPIMVDNHISALVNEPTFFSGLRTTASFTLYLFYSGRYKDRKRIYTMLNKFQNKIKNRPC